MSKLLMVEPQANASAKKNKPAKDRSFEVHLLAMITARDIWEGGNAKGNTARPVLMMYAQTESAVRAFTANLRSGRTAQLINKEGSYRRVDGSIEILAKTPYRWVQQRIEGSCGARGETVMVVTVYNPEIFQLDPGTIDPENCSFVIAPPDWWLEKQNAWLAGDAGLVETIKEYCRVLELPKLYKLTEDVLVTLVPRAAYFMAYLNARTKLALPISLEFQLQVYLAALKRGIVKFWYDQRPDNMGFAPGTSSHYFSAEGTDTAGMSTALYCNTTQSDLASFLEAQCKLYKTANDRLNEKYPARLEAQQQRRLLQFKRAEELASAVRKLESRYDEPETTALAGPSEADVVSRPRRRSPGSGRTRLNPTGPLQDENPENFSFDYLEGMEVEPVLIDEIPEDELDLVEDYTPPPPEPALDVDEVLAEAAAILDPVEALLAELRAQFGDDWDKPAAPPEPEPAPDLAEMELAPEIKPDGKVAVAARPRKPARVVKDLDEAFPFGLEQLTLIFGDIERIEVEKPARKKKEAKK